MAAGPVDIHDRVREAYGRQVLHHYDPQFQELFREATAYLAQVFETQGDVVIMQGEAVLGLEASSACTVKPGDKCLNLVSGVYGAGYARYFKAYSGQDPLEIRVPYNQAVDPDRVEGLLREEGDIRFIAVVHSETPSGTLNPVGEICRLARQYGALTIVDAVSSFAGMPVPVDQWGVDLCVAGPHKCLGAAPGSALLAVSDRAWKAMREHPTPRRRSYLSLLDWKELWMEGGRFPFSVFVTQIYGLHAALEMVLEEGLPQRFRRHEGAGRMCRAGVQAMGLELWPAEEAISASCVTVAHTPQGLEASRIVALMRERYGVAITGSLGEMAEKVLRIGHMGHTAQPDYVLRALSALESTLSDLGLPVDPGQGVAAAQAVA